jgi:hypothetical protein
MSRIRKCRRHEIYQIHWKEENSKKKRIRKMNSRLFNIFPSSFYRFVFHVLLLPHRESISSSSHQFFQKRDKKFLLGTLVSPPYHSLSEAMITVVVFHFRFFFRSLSHLCYTHKILLKFNSHLYKFYRLPSHYIKILFIISLAFTHRLRYRIL